MHTIALLQSLYFNNHFIKLTDHTKQTRSICFGLFTLGCQTELCLPTIVTCFNSHSRLCTSSAKICEFSFAKVGLAYVEDEDQR